MHKNDVIAYFGNGTKTAKALGISKSTVSLWDVVIPWKYALLVEKVTKGGIKYDAALYQKNNTAGCNHQ